MLDASGLLQSAFWLFFIAAALSLITGFVSRKMSLYVSGVSGAVASLLGGIGAVECLISQSRLSFTLPWIQVPFASTELTVDPLAAFFILVICLAALPISIYSIGYLQAEYTEKSVGVMGALYHLFILSMLLVVTAGNSLLFLIFWELMALLSFALVVSDSGSVVSQKAGFLYLLMTHVGTAFILMLFLLLSQQSGSYDFSAYHLASRDLPESLRTILFLFVIIGFGAKAGIIPLHIWLPEAHPAAPSHISALMSGVMIKTAVYGILRCTFDFLSPFPEGWGIILATLGILTALLGIIYASVENDLKRLLAYSSIENMGIILLPIGVSMLFYSLGYPVLAMASMAAGLFHLLNHAVFKSLLFLGAGAVLSTAHTRSLENLGGLIHKMPYTACCFLVGSLAIAAFPPLNGFASEWLIYQSLVSGIQLDSDFLPLFLVLCAVLLGLVGALAAATFVKAFSTGFLALPRSRHAEHAHEVSRPMCVGMGLLVFFCLALGIGPTWILPMLTHVSQTLLHSPIPTSLVSANALAIQMDTPYSTAYAPILVFLILLFLLPLSMWLPRILGTKTEIRKEDTWVCGVTLVPAFEYTPSGFSQPLEVVFAKLHKTIDAYYNTFYLPCAKGLMWLAHALKVIQMGSLQVYLSYILVTLILCLGWIQR